MALEMVSEKEKIRRQKISNAMKGRKFTDEWRKKISQAKKCHIVSEETRRKISKTKRGVKLSKETRIKMSKSRIGHKVSEKTRRKIREANTGKHISKSARMKISLSNKKRIGEKHPNWKGGISFEPYSSEFNDQLKNKIRERDKYICQLCSIKQKNLEGFLKQLDIHHKDYNKKNCREDNLISLCRGCNVKVNYNRERWVNYFKEVITCYQ